MEKPLQKRARHENSAEADENDGAAQSCKDKLDMNIYLTYDILRIVFQYLNGRDLANAAMVCRSWLEGANSEKWARSPQCFIQYYKESGNVLDCIKDVKVKPSIEFFFISAIIPPSIETYILDLLPDNSDAILLYIRGSILNDIEMEDDNYHNIVCAFLPQIPSLKIDVFEMNCSNLNLLELLHSKEFLRLIDTIETCARNHKMCLMLFCNDLCSYDTPLLLDRNIQKSKRNQKIVSLWGGIVDNITFKHVNDARNKSKRHQGTYENEPRCVAILITGPIKTWSIIVDKKCKTKEQVEEKLQLFKNQVKLRKHSIGFMFSCRARGKSMYHGEKNVESSIFKRLFPKVPLVGCFGNGEFGKNTIYVDKANEKKSKSTKKGHKSRKTAWYNEFSTTFMIITYG